MAKLDASAVATLLVEIGQRPVWISSALSNALTVESCSRAALPSAKDFFAYAAVSVAMAAKAFEAVACVVRTRSTLIRLNFCIVSNCSTMVSLLRRFLEAASLDRRTFGPGNPVMLHCTINVKRKITRARYGALHHISTSYTGQQRSGMLRSR